MYLSDYCLLRFVQEEELVATSVSGRADDLSWRCSSDTFDLNGRAFENSENWAVLSTEGDKPSPRFDVINHLKNGFKLRCSHHYSVSILKPL
jgi:hypothetical protein